MGKYSTLRTFMRRFKTVKTDHVLKDCELVIEGDSFFRQTYKGSGCNFILGGEFDRYADYLRTKLMTFIESNVTCYVIFNGTMEANIEKRKAIHTKIIDDRGSMMPGDAERYFEPIFMKDVYKQVLEELGIKYCVIEHDTRETLLDVSDLLDCPVLTSHIEQCLIGMTCILPDSLFYDDTKKQISCKMLTPEAYKDHIRIYDSQKPLFMTILDENGPMFDKIPQIIGSNPKIPVGPLLYWMRGKKIAPAIDKLAKMLDTEAERQAFRSSVDGLRQTICYNYERRSNIALRYFKGVPITSYNERDWFTNEVLTGNIASPYINLKKHQIFSGSWAIYDQSKRDAILPSLDIAMYGYSVLKNSQEKVTFIGRMKNSVYVGSIEPPVSRQLDPDMFQKFIDGALSGFDWTLLQSVPEDSRLLIITLVYYTKVNDGFMKAAYSIILSYVMLGPVSEKVGLMKKNKITVSVDSDDQEDSSCTYKDCLNAANTLINYFYEGSIKDTFDRSIIHDLAEFQHCLQHMNFLNKLCGKQIKCTNYYKTYNGTFVFNVLLKLTEHENSMLFFENNLKTSPTVWSLYNDIKNVFESLICTVSNKTN